MRMARGEGAHEGCVVHAVNNYPLMFWGVFSNASEVGFYDMVSVEERHLPIGFYPDLDRHVSKIRGNGDNTTLYLAY